MKYSSDEVNRFRKYHQVTKNGVAFDWWLVNCDGSGYCLIREPHHTDADIDEAMRFIKSERDVVGKIKIALVQS